jgi:hypothetical protein
MLGESRRTSLYSESTAQWLSTFVPGLGQLYVGDFKNALNALALNSLLFYWGTDLLVSHKYFDSVIEFSGVFLRYYLGNRYRAAELAREKNEKKQHDQAETILSLSAKLVHDQ